MKKYFKILMLILILSISRIKGVNAESFYEDNYISGVYANLIDGDFSKPQQMRFIRRKSDNKPSYCLTPRVYLYDTENYTQYYTFRQDVLNFTEAKLDKVNQIAYFGYGYPGHTDDYWYAITQIMIWKEIEPNMDIFFTDILNGNRISKFENEMNEINNLINEWNKGPAIYGGELTANNEYEYTDNLNVLHNYEVVHDNSIDMSIDNNTLKIKTYDKGMFRTMFKKESNLYVDNPYVYTANRGQDIFVQGSIGGKSYTVFFNVTNNKIQITKQDSESLKYLQGAIYNLYDDKNEYVGKIITDSNGIGEISHIKTGKYLLKEEKAPEGYLIDNNTYSITVNSELTKVELNDDIIKANLIVNKTINDDNNISYEEGIKFNIYDLNNKLITTLETDHNGFADTILKYGKYKIVQLNTTLGYKKVKDFYVDVKDTNDIIYNLEDKIVKSKLKINKLDNETFKLIDTASFKIKDLNKNIYLDNTYKTNNGTIELDIKGGRYLLEEITPPINYIKGDNAEFIIDEELDNKILSLNVFNVRKKGIIKIIKLGKLKNNSMLYLNNVVFDIYDMNNNLIDTITTNKLGIALSKELELGKYYIIEKSTIDNFILDNTKYEIDLIDNLEDNLIIKDIIIINNEEQYYCKIHNNNYYDKEGNIVDIDKFNESCNEKKETINNYYNSNIYNYPKDKKIEKNSTNDKIKKIIYPKTSDKDMYIYIIIGYLAFIGLLYLIASIKDEK